MPTMGHRQLNRPIATRSKKTPLGTGISARLSAVVQFDKAVHILEWSSLQGGHSLKPGQTLDSSIRST